MIIKSFVNQKTNIFKVRWDRKNIGIYKIGYKGRFEVKLM